MLGKILQQTKRLIPSRLFRLFQPAYHYVLAWLAYVYYGNPSQYIKLIGGTGTKGKSTTIEILNAILEEAGFSTALSSTLRTKIAGVSEDNLYKMTTPGRFFIQRFLKRAVIAGCDYAIVELTSQSVLQNRHRFLELDTLIFTGIHPEHIEAHGSFDKYLNSKLQLVKRLGKSTKERRVAIANIDDPLGELFLRENIELNIGYHLVDWPGYKFALPGDFNKLNAIAAITCAVSEDVGIKAIKKATENMQGVPGRMEYISAAKDMGIEVIVDYAHTTGSLEAVYKLFRERPIIAVLGSCGGGRDKWKRPQMAATAEQYCKHIILTNEDPYDEDPKAIVGDMLVGMKDQTKAIVEMDRRKAIAKALSLAIVSPLGGGTASPIVLITGKGTDPFIMGPHGTKQEWSDKRVAEEELAKLAH